ncbi:DUF3604 domain-containing protein [Pseudomonas sp. N040]|uniref:DUF3604 domain-containing protein n=1 Tax=Pseudomonas sp. N040 TaxID=2785325 RepID=UPI0018A2BB0A|nr:DUF3604 domain-containing protein [Pseudomonas sp. N040]MBF7729097.1 DUF3604 domain-containing protein [Pseudomonas sp. N040]MBW7012737.1 DUF3604 domain-containing protein [Pseudomonas sp. N040]
MKTTITRLSVAITLSSLSWMSQAASEYSPNVGQALPNRVLFGDTHLHTAYSTDAGMLGNRLGPAAAYRFAMGEEVTSSTGVKAKLARPLDFLVVADHAENLGFPVQLAQGNAKLLGNAFGQKMIEFVKAKQFAEAFAYWRSQRMAGTDPTAGLGLEKDAWDQLTTLADQYNQPGRFTALIGFEWTSAPGGRNLHRNVIFRDDKSKAGSITPFSTYDSPDPEQLWQWMADYEAKSGGKVLAIPHNGNLSNGLMFDDVTLTTQKPLDKAYAERRARWEPVVEVTQMKGTGETHPLLSPNDEFANFELLDKAALAGPVPTTPEMYPREYARAALERGLAYEAKLGANPFKFGMIGSTDSHTSLATSEENNFFGKVTPVEPSPRPERFNELITGRMPNAPAVIQQAMWKASASGLAAVWARENTREAIWDALARKEVYATTGTRLEVRVFAGTDFTAADLTRADWVANGYAKGVPMGGDLQVNAQSQAPSLLIKASRSADGANLDRIQVIKGWLDSQGQTQEKVYDVAWSGARQPGKDGKLPPVGNTVDVKNASYSNSIGAPELETYWQDPAFKAGEKAFYYVRVLEIPTPRWTVYDAKVFGTTLPDEAPTAIQDRAYTSPVWVNSL